MRTTFYDVAVKGERGQWYPIGTATTTTRAQEMYADYVANGGIPGETLMTPRHSD